MGLTAEFRAFLDQANKALSEDVLHGSSAQMKTDDHGDLESKVYEGWMGRGNGYIATFGKYLEHKLSTDKIHRTADQRATNNALRHEFLKALDAEIRLRGFSGFSIAKLPSELKEALKLSDFGLSEGDSWDKVISTGKPLTARRILAINKALNATLGPVQNKTVADSRTLVLGILSGRILPSRNTSYQKETAKLQLDVENMLAAFKTMSKRTNSSRELTTVIRGKVVTLRHEFPVLGNEQWNEAAPGGRVVVPKLMATVDGVTVEVPGGAESMLEALERDISSNVALYGREHVKARMVSIENRAKKEIGAFRMNPDGARYQVPSEFNRLGLYYQHVLRSILGENNYKSIRFETLSLAQLSHLAHVALNGGYDSPRAVTALRREINETAKPEKLKQLNSERVLQLVSAYDGQMKTNADDANRRVAVIPPAPKLEAKMPTKQELADRRLDREIHELFADLIQRSDTWAADRSKKSPGRQLFDTCLKHKEAFVAVLKDPTLLDTFDIKKTNPDDPDVPIKKSIKDMLDGMLGEELGGKIKLLPKEAVEKLLDIINDYWTLAVDQKAPEDAKGFARGEILQFQDELVKSVDDELAKLNADYERADGVLEKTGINLKILAAKAKRLTYGSIADAFSVDVIKDVLEAIEEGAGSIEETVATAMASVEDTVAKAVQTTFGLTDAEMTSLRAKPREGVMQQTEVPPVGEMWKKNLKAIAGDGAISPKSGMGRFMLQGIVQYFTSVSAVDQRTMLASLLRYTRKGATQGQVLGAFLKGAGPIMQKELQGIPSSQMPDDLQVALADMKDSLASIPDHIVKAQINQMVLESKGEITSVVVEQSLGAASVGQAFLCKMTLKDGSEEECVIKLLRPDVQPRAQRERVFFEKLAATIPGMKETFAGDLRTIMDELDLTIEAENARGGAIYHMNPDLNLKSVQIHPLVKPTSNLLVLKAAPGDTVAKVLRETKEECKKIATATRKDDIGHTIFVTKGLDNFLETREKLVKRYRTLVGVNQRLEAVVRKWTSEAVFRSGYFHGDMHAGNMMFAEKTNEKGEQEFELTIIDYGNATRLTEEQQENVVRLLLTAGARNASGFMDAYRGLLSPAGRRAFDRAGNTLKNEIREILKKGTAAQTAERMMAVMMMTQRRGIELPETIYKFVKSEMRLASAMDDVTNEMEAVKAQLHALWKERGGDATKTGRFSMLDPVGHLESGAFVDGADDDRIQHGLSLAAELLDDNNIHSFTAYITAMFHPNRPSSLGFPYVIYCDGYNDRREKINPTRRYLPEFVDDYVETIAEGADPEKAATLRTALANLKAAFSDADKAAREQGLLDDGLTIYRQFMALEKDMSHLSAGTLEGQDPKKAAALRKRLNALDQILASKDGALKAFIDAAKPILRDRFETVKKRLESTTDLPETVEFGVAFSDEMLKHSGDALQILGFIEGGKLAHRMEDVGDKDATRLQTIRDTLETVHQQFMLDYSFAGAPKVLTEPNRLTIVNGMIGDFVQPPEMGRILGTRHWAQNAQNRALFLEMMRVNMTDYHKRLEESGMLDDFKATVYDEPEYEPELPREQLLALQADATAKSHIRSSAEQEHSKMLAARREAVAAFTAEHQKQVEAHQKAMADYDAIQADPDSPMDVQEARQAEEESFAALTAKYDEDYDRLIADWDQKTGATQARLDEATRILNEAEERQGNAALIPFNNKTKREAHEKARKMAMSQLMGTIAQLPADKGGVANLKTAFLANNLTNEDLDALKAEVRTLVVDDELIRTFILDGIDALRRQAIPEEDL